MDQVTYVAIQRSEADKALAGCNGKIKGRKFKVRKSSLERLAGCRGATTPHEVKK